MIKDIMAANEATMPNDREMAVLREHFPACFRPDGSFDLERFKEYLNDKVTVTNEGYELRFLGKNYARLLASVDTTTVIVPDEEHNNKPDNSGSENIPPYSISSYRHTVTNKTQETNNALRTVE